ncbi:hypothetical protein M2163_004986 [Streptomyces sp. SAI-135]|uniref:hypothetical protein n=1 Tax=unclassified Streptomyces TaxID=2593676 RepID=UPI0024751DE2|nr:MULTISPECIES: hypothetical protein [unclassified Streptomyces]MDH6518031.1 hypothetical protein [Streptomyces sp. SAI-090]MDH6617878.1 hypothetical protein [Streptomyces sp. SAI-135]
MTGIGVEAGAQAARSRALAVLRIRSRALAVALLPAAVAVVLLAGGSTDHLVGGFWDTARLVMSVIGVVVLLAAGAVALVVARARPAVSPTVAIAEESAPDLYRMVRDLADRLDVPAPSAIALTPDCDSWLEDRTHPAHGPPPKEGREDEIAGVRGSQRGAPAAPVLVIGSPFLWWMRVGELRAVLAPVVAGTGPSAHPDIAAARRFVRGLDAAVAVGSVPGRCPLTRVMCAGVAWVARLLLRSCREHATQMERGVAAAAAERAQAVDYGLRIVAQEQVGLAYAGWDRLLTRVALPAWRMGRWPSRLDAGVVAALTELSRRDRLAEGFASRLGERPACDLLEEPGAIDEAASLLAARLFHGGPAETGPDWSPVDWQEYPEEVVDRKWRLDAARLHRVLDAQEVRRPAEPTAPGSDAPTLSRVMAHLSAPRATDAAAATSAADGSADADPTPGSRATDPMPRTGTADSMPESRATDRPADPAAHPTAPTATDGPAPDHAAAPPEPTSPRAEPISSGAEPASPGATSPGAEPTPPGAEPTPLRAEPASPQFEPTSLEAEPTSPGAEPPSPQTLTTTEPAEPAPPSQAAAPADSVPAPPSTALDADHDTAREGDGPDVKSEPSTHDHAAARHEPAPAVEAETLAAALTAELAREEAAAPPSRSAADITPWDDTALPLFPLQPPRSARELLTDHVTAMVCCAAIDTAGAAPGLDWLDGPSLLINGERAADLAPRVLSLVEDGDPAPLRAWLVKSGIRPEKPVRLV